MAIEATPIHYTQPPEFFKWEVGFSKILKTLRYGFFAIKTIQIDYTQPPRFADQG